MNNSTNADISTRRKLKAVDRLFQFLRENCGVLVTTAANGDFACQCCGANGVFASGIPHADGCVFRLAVEATEEEPNGVGD